MRRGAFTLIEVMAVIVLLGLMAGAVTWSFARNVRGASRETAMSQVMRADRMARLAARRFGRPCVLRIDIGAQRVWRVVEVGSRIEKSPATSVSGCRLDRIAIAGAVADSGIVDVPYSTAGHSASYGIRLVRQDWRGWLIFCGLTGQATVIENEQEAQNLLSLAGARPDAP